MEAVRSVATMRSDEKFDRRQTWVAETFLSESERKEKLERECGITPLKRYTEIKAGVIVSSVGIGVMIFLYFLMQGIILSGQNPPSDAAILSRVWLAGIIPFFVGFALIVNGLVVSRKQVELARRGLIVDGARNAGDEPSMLRSANTTEFITPRFGITEGTTKHLSSPTEKP
jgi:hypothetical protein